MRKWLIAGLLTLMFPWLLSLIWMRNVGAEGTEEGLIALETEQEKYSAYGHVLLERNGIQTYESLEDYLPGIILCQIDPGMELETLKCQAVIARTYVYRLMDGRDEIDEKELDFSYPGEYHDSAFWKSEKRERMISELKRCEQAVKETSGVVMKYENRCILPLFHKRSSGRTRKGEEEFPYLMEVESKWDVEQEGYISEEAWGLSEFTEKLGGISDVGNALTEASISQIQIVKKDDSGYVEQIQIGRKTYTGEEIQYALGLSSCCYSLKIEKGMVCARVKGSGHGYGLSQTGANAMAKTGWGYQEILQYYYPGISVGV